MSLLDGFELLETITGVPSMSISKNGVSFNRAAIEKLGCPRYVLTLIDKQGCRFAIVECSKNDRGARDFVKTERNISNGVRWNNHDLRATLEALMGWNLSADSWKVEGKFSDQDRALIFDLYESERQQIKRAKRKEASSSGSNDIDNPF